MATNVAANLRAFGCEIELYTNEPQSLTKTRFIDSKSKQQMLRVDEGNISSSAMDLPYAVPDFILISDYNKGFLTIDYIDSLLNYAKDFSIPVYIDSKRKDLWIFSGTNCVIKVNEDEFNAITRWPLDSDVIVTQGSRGATLYYEGKPSDCTSFLAPPVEAFDVTGAGDVFTASLAALSQCMRFESAIQEAVNLASVSVQHHGTYTLTKNDIYEICN